MTRLVLGALMVTPIYFLNTINDAAALLPARGADFLSVFDNSQRHALVMVLLRIRGQGVLANEVFWDSGCFLSACWYTPSAYPRRLADAQLLRLSGYECHRDVVAARRAKVSNWVFPVMFGELAIMLWLIIMGAKETQPFASAA